MPWPGSGLSVPPGSSWWGRLRGPGAGHTARSALLGRLMEGCDFPLICGVNTRVVLDQEGCLCTSLNLESYAGWEATPDRF